MRSDQRIGELISSLIDEARNILRGDRTSRSSYGSALIVDDEAVRRFANRLTLLRTIAGPIVRPWSDKLKHDGTVLVPSYIEAPLSALQVIDEAIKGGLLVRYEDLVFAEAFSDLYEQAQYLQKQGYFLAAGVLLRAILEEKLKKLCERNGCIPEKKAPTINDYNQALYTADSPLYDKSMMLHVTSLASIGNDAAHNAPSFDPKSIARMSDGVGDFMSKFIG